MEKVLFWTFYPLKTPPQLDAQGILRRRGVRYAPLRACAKQLGVDFEAVKAAWLRSLPWAGFSYKTTNRDQHVRCYRWKRSEYYPIHRVALLVPALAKTA